MEGHICQEGCVTFLLPLDLELHTFSLGWMAVFRDKPCSVFWCGVPDQNLQPLRSRLALTVLISRFPKLPVYRMSSAPGGLWPTGNKDMVVTEEPEISAEKPRLSC